jgi:predicted DNA-binding protein (UPF0251 family)
MLIINRGFIKVKPRGRPKKLRFIKTEPEVGLFSPRGRPGRPDEIELALDEYEAIRLADHKKTSHKIAGTLMGISRQTFERILRKAHQKLADGLINGKIIRVTGGSFKIG